jgi:hypothetical protein
MRIVYLLIIILLVFACTKKDKIPGDVIPQQKMEKVLWDMILADRFAAQFLVKDSSKINLKAKTFELYEQVFQINGISRENFISSFKFYMSRPDISKIMFDSISVRANRMKPEVFNRARELQ